MDVRKWLSQKLEEPWSAYRMCTLLSRDMIDGIVRKLADIDPVSLSRVLLSLMLLKPGQIREISSNHIDDLIDACDQSPLPSPEFDWPKFLARSLKGFGKSQCIEIDMHRHGELQTIVESLLASCSIDEGVPTWMLPAEAQYLEPSLLPSIVPTSSESHFTVIKPFAFEYQSGGSEHVGHPSAPVVSSTINSVAPAATLPTRPLPMDLPKIDPNKLTDLGKQRSTIKTIGLMDSAGLQDKIRKRQRPSDEIAAQRKREKYDLKRIEREEKEAKRLEEREEKRRRKGEERETRQREKEVAREYRNKALAEIAEEKAHQLEESRMEKAARQAAQLLMRQQHSLAAGPATIMPHLPSATGMSGFFSEPGYQMPLAFAPGATSMSRVPPGVFMASAVDALSVPEPQLPSPISDQQSKFANMFVDANVLSDENRLLIEQFLSGLPVSHPDANDGVYQVIMSENNVVDPQSQSIFLEIIVFEMNFARGSWRKLKRRKKLVNSNS